MFVEKLPALEVFSSSSYFAHFLISRLTLNLRNVLLYFRAPVPSAACGGPWPGILSGGNRPQEVTRIITDRPSDHLIFRAINSYEVCGVVGP